MKPDDDKLPDPLGRNWDHDDMLARCAWCLRRVPEDQEVFGISLRLHSEAFLEVKPGTVQPLYLPEEERAVPLMVVADNSPAKKEGKDAMLQVCSDACGRALQAALRRALERTESGTSFGA